MLNNQLSCAMTGRVALPSAVTDPREKSALSGTGYGHDASSIDNFTSLGHRPWGRL